MTKKLRTRVQFDANVLAKGQALAEEENRSVMAHGITSVRRAAHYTSM